MRLGRVWKWGLAGMKETTPRKFKLFVQNDNLQFEDDATQMMLYPFIPPLKTKDAVTYTISEDANVLALTFKSKKAAAETKGISFSLKYAQLAALLGVPAKSGQVIWIHSDRIEEGRKRWKTLEIRDNSKLKAIEFSLRQGEGQVARAEELKGTGGELKANFKLEYPQQRIWRALIEGSLFELSGQKLMYEIRAMEETQIIASSQIQKRREITREMKQFFDN